MKAAIITIAGISSRFNEGILEEKKQHKAIYYEKSKTNSLIFHLLEKCMFADVIILVGGSKYNDVQSYCEGLPDNMRNKVELIYNAHYADLASGYSLYLGINELFARFKDIEEVLFVEGDLDIDKESFNKVIKSKKNVLTYNYEPIYANKAVVLYQDNKKQYGYAFNASHGVLEINTPFFSILNSGQIWKFIDIKKLKKANEKFYIEEKEGTNLHIIQNYIDLCGYEDFELIGLSRWTNCNTRKDYKKILSFWEEESR